MNCLLLDTLRHTDTQSDSPGQIPVWLMRQAGRYMPEYQQLKAKHGFLGLCQNPKLATEVTLQPISAFGPDAAILFADIMLPAQCLGFDIEFNPGPIVKNSISDPRQIFDLHDDPQLDAVSYVFEAVSLIKESLGEYTNSRGRKALLGFAATPWTLACYLLDQTPYKHFAGTSVFAAKYPAEFHQLLKKLTSLTIAYLRAQVAAGADALQLFDSWAGVLSANDYQKLSLPYINEIQNALADCAPLILYANGSSHLLETLSQTKVDALSIDWRTDLERAAELAPEKVIQGNLDPSLLFLGEKQLRQRTEQMLLTAPKGRYIANLGHGVLQKTPVENVKQFIESVQKINF